VKSHILFFYRFFVEFYYLTSRKRGKRMNYNVISSGSSGNCVKINDVMIDIGVPFNKIKDELYDVKYLLITHTHSDHLKLNTYTSLIKMFPRIKIYGNYEVGQVVDVDKIVNAGYEFETKDYTFYPFPCVHDVLCYGFTWEYEKNRILYATDTSSLDFAPPGPYDYLFLESNHDEKKLEEVRNKPNKGYDPYESGKRHLSTQQAKNFYYMNRRDRDSELIELHKSARFY
jgi:Cft2 family RNA processing exonuclease